MRTLLLLLGRAMEPQTLMDKLRLGLASQVALGHLSQMIACALVAMCIYIQYTLCTILAQGGGMSLALRCTSFLSSGDNPAAKGNRVVSPAMGTR